MNAKHTTQSARNAVSMYVYTTAMALSLVAGMAHAQTPSFVAVTGLSGGAVSLIAGDRNIANPMVAVGITGVGLFTGVAGSAASGTAVAWSAQTCDACAYARNAAWDDKGQLWVATSGQGLWRGAPGSAFTEIKLPGSNIVQWVSRAADGTMWAVLGNGVVQVKADNSTTVIGKNAAQLGLDKLAMPSSAGGIVSTAFPALNSAMIRSASATSGAGAPATNCSWSTRSADLPIPAMDTKASALARFVANMPRSEPSLSSAIMSKRRSASLPIALLLAAIPRLS